MLLLLVTLIDVDNSSSEWSPQSLHDFLIAQLSKQVTNQRSLWLMNARLAVRVDSPQRRNVSR